MEEVGMSSAETAGDPGHRAQAGIGCASRRYQGVILRISPVPCSWWSRAPKSGFPKYKHIIQCGASLLWM